MADSSASQKSSKETVFSLSQVPQLVSDFSETNSNDFIKNKIVNPKLLTASAIQKSEQIVPNPVSLNTGNFLSPSHFLGEMVPTQ